MPVESAEPHIGTLNEGSLHAAIKQVLAEPGDRFEVPLERFVIDILRPGTGRRSEGTGINDDLLIEIQTSGFGALGAKLDWLLESHRIHLVHPVATGTWIVRPDMADRKSPKRGSIYSLFDELVSVPTLLDNPNLTLELFLVEQEAHKVEDPSARRGRGGWRTVDRRLRRIVERRRFDTTAQLLELLPANMPAVFTTADIADHAKIQRRQAQAMAYCLRANGLILDLGRKRDGVHYGLAGSSRGPARPST